MPAEPAARPPSSAADAKRLLRLARTGALATLEREAGGPLTTLIGVASDWDGSPLFLMSELSRHTRNLAADPRASLLLTGAQGRGDPLNHPRLTISGPVGLHPDAGSRQRYLRRNPKSKLYASFGDFAVRRMRIETIHFNGGFGRADALTLSDILTAEGDVVELIAWEDRLLQDVNALGKSVVARLVSDVRNARRAWRAIGLDADGLDLASGGLSARVTFAAPAFDPVSWRARLDERLEESVS